MSIDKNDPRLTAFALGELPPEEAAELQAALKNDPTLAAEVEAIREVAEKLKTTLAEEPLPKPEPVQPLKTPKKRFPLIEIGVVVTVSLLLIALFLPTSRSAREAAHNLNGQMQPVELTSPAPRQEADISHEGLRCGHSISGSERKTDAFVDDNYSTTISVGDKKPIAFTADNSGEKALQRIAGPRPKQAIIHPAKKPTGKPGDTLELKDKSTKEIPSEAKFSRLSELRQKVRYGGNTTNKPAAGEPDMRMMVTPRVVIEQEEVLVADRMRQLSLRSPTGPHNTESYDKITENEFKRVAEHPLSTFSIDVDTASYSVVRKMLTQGRMPVPGAVRLEEMINYFDYSYQPPSDGKPFATHVDAARCPWNNKHNLVRIGLKGRVIEKKERQPANLVFLLDVSGSMRSPNKLPLLKDAMKLLVENLNAKDRVAIVVYAGASGLVLPSTKCGDKQKILESLDRLKSGGSTNGGAGIKLAYATAAANHIEKGVNRVILCTDGDFNVGTTNQSELVSMIEKKAKEGVFLTLLGFGMGNYKDSTLEKLADKGNGNYGYVDTINEAKKLLVEGLAGTLVTIAKDVKIQVEFNPHHVKGYRLLGYENRMLRKEDFNDDTKDAGEIGAGHTVTALYEIIPADSAETIAKPAVDKLKYQKEVETTDAARSAEMLTVKLRYKEPAGQKSKLLEFPVKNQIVEFNAANVDLKFASSVAAFGMILRCSQFKGDADYDKIIRWAKSSLAEDEFNYREEFLRLVRTAKSLSNK